ncbi:hypothetical protein [Streptomyces californicus]|uniref:hypothetical protein n=1 Tax=Streptomyces californicus TaxID=67351 RepID=UPI0036B7D0C1
MSKLPSDAEMTKLFVLGKLSNTEIAQMYEVTPQAVDKRWRKLGLERRPITNQANDLIARVWKIKTVQGAGSHHTLSPIMYLRVWLRMRLGDKGLSARQKRDALSFERRIRRDNVVLAYDPGTEKGWSWEPREPKDDRLVIRWPEGEARPPADELIMFRLPDVPSE